MNDDLLQAVRAWMEKAFSDWTVVEILIGDARSPANAICFHCQQYVEKLLKAYLTMHGHSVPRTHDLRLLVQLAETTLPSLASLRDAAGELAVHGVQSRYPDEVDPVSQEDMHRMVDVVDSFAAILLPELPKVS